jgi:DNA-binding NarL/FixJ family response regulator
MSATTSVYIVEDSQAVRDHLQSFFHELPNVRVVGSSDGPHAIERIRELRPAIVTLDLSLGRRSGIELLQAIKRDPNPPTVIVLTHFTDRPYREHCRKLGADYFFDKAIELSSVLDLIGSFSSGVSGFGDT